MWTRPGHIKVSGSHQIPKHSGGVVDIYGFFEEQLDGGTYLLFDENIANQHLRFICTNFNGNPAHGSYIQVNGVVIASDWTLAPDGVDNSVNGGVGYRMTRGHTVVAINPATGSIISANNYDTYGNPSLCTTIKTLLEALTPGTVVAIGTYDATSCTQDLRDALTTYFGDNAYTNTWASQRISQMFLGKRNSTG
jgi:hypothetical protein